MSGAKVAKPRAKSRPKGGPKSGAKAGANPGARGGAEPEAASEVVETHGEFEAAEVVETAEAAEAAGAFDEPEAADAFDAPEVEPGYAPAGLFGAAEKGGPAGPAPARDFHGAAPTDPYCDVCGLALDRVISGSEVSFVCPCGEVKAGTPADRLVRRADIRASAAGGQLPPGSLALFATLVRNAPFDPAAEVVDRPCEDCGAPRTARTVVSDAMVVFYSCRCGSVRQSR